MQTLGYQMSWKIQESFIMDPKNWDTGVKIISHLTVVNMITLQSVTFKSQSTLKTSSKITNIAKTTDVFQILRDAKSALNRAFQVCKLKFTRCCRDCWKAQKRTHKRKKVCLFSFSDPHPQRRHVGGKNYDFRKNHHIDNSYRLYCSKNSLLKKIVIYITMCCQGFVAIVQPTTLKIFLGGFWHCFDKA